MGIKIVNCTPHDVHHHTNDGRIVTYPRGASTPRVAMALTLDDGIFATPTYGLAVGLPEPEPDTVLIVSSYVQSACPERDDLVVPGELRRDADGRIIGCGRFLRQPKGGARC